MLFRDLFDDCPCDELAAMHSSLATSAEALGDSEAGAVNSLPDLERSHGAQDIHERLNAVQSGLTAVQSQMQAVQEQQASIVGAIAAQDAVLARIVSLLSPST